jgi:TatD DNase family protein
MSKKKKNIPLPELDEGVILVDTHCHLDMAAYKNDLENVVERAETAGVSKIITIGIDLKSSHEAVKLAQRFRSVSAAVGVHPHDSKSFSTYIGDELKKLSQKEEVVAYGEIGLDFVKKYSSKETQLKVFAQQVELAKEINLPLIIHDREAHDPIYTILKESGPFDAGGVIHCFSGNTTDALRFIDLGFYISIPGVVTFNKAEVLQDAARHIPLTSLLIETDGPFLAPVPRRGKRNEPSYALYTAKKVAELKGISLGDLARQTTINAHDLFGI